MRYYKNYSDMLSCDTKTVESKKNFRRFLLTSIMLHMNYYYYHYYDVIQWNPDLVLSHSVNIFSGPSKAQYKQHTVCLHLSEFWFSKQSTFFLINFPWRFIKQGFHCIYNVQTMWHSFKVTKASITLSSSSLSSPPCQTGNVTHYNFVSSSLQWCSIFLFPLDL